MLNAQMAFGTRRFLAEVQRPEFRPKRIFISRESLISSVQRCPRAVHGLETESIGIFNILIQPGIECSVTQKDQSNLFHEAKESDVVLRSDFNLDGRRDRPVVSLWQIRSLIRIG